MSRPPFGGIDLDKLAREHAERRARIADDASMCARKHAERCAEVDQTRDLAREHAERCASFASLADRDETVVDEDTIARASSPDLSVVVEQCAERRAALDVEARSTRRSR